MIIKLPGADFSANNIGRITISQTLTPEVETILSKFSREFTQDQKLKFQDFWDGLVDSGIRAKISNLIIPALAANVTEAFIPVIGPALVQTPTVEYSLYQGGIYAASYSSGQIPMKYKVIDDVNTKDMHIAVYVPYNNYVDEERPLSGVLKSGKSYIFTRFGTLMYLRGDDNRYYRAANASFKFALASSSSTEVFALNDDSICGLVSGSAPSTHDPVTQEFSLKEGTFYAGASVTNRTYNNFSYSMISLGKSLTRDEAHVYYGLAKSLMDSLLTNG